MLVRLQKYIADCQVASRRKAEELIAQGKIRLNGAVVAEPGVRVDPEKDAVEYDGKTLVPKGALVYIMLHKPEGYITTVKDQFGRRAVTELTADIPARLFPVGRLDCDTSGLLLMTNDGGLAYKLTHPKYMVEKVYIARAAGEADETALARLRSGAVIDGVKTAPAKAVVVKRQAGSFTVKITIHEGRNRQVRKMLESIGCRTVALKRVATGRLYLGDLPKGAYRSLTDAEVAYLKNL